LWEALSSGQNANDLELSGICPILAQTFGRFSGAGCVCKNSVLTYKVTRLEDIKPAIRDALRWMDGCLRPFALVPSYDLTRLKA
jgi:hypothetical protein